MVYFERSVLALLFFLRLTTAGSPKPVAPLIHPKALRSQKNTEPELVELDNMKQRLLFEATTRAPLDPSVRIPGLERLAQPIKGHRKASRQCPNLFNLGQNCQSHLDLCRRDLIFLHLGTLAWLKCGI